MVTGSACFFRADYPHSQRGSVSCGSGWSVPCVSDTFSTHQHANGHTKQKLHTSHTSHPLHSFSCSRRVTHTALTDTDQRFRVAIPRVNPGSEPEVQPPRQTGVWTVADTQTQHILLHRLKGECVCSHDHFYCELVLSLIDQVSRHLDLIHRLHLRRAAGFRFVPIKRHDTNLPGRKKDRRAD